MKLSFYTYFFTVFLSPYSCQVTHLYGTVRPRPTGLLGYVTLEPTSTTTARSVDRDAYPTTGLYSAYNYDNSNNRDRDVQATTGLYSAYNYEDTNNRDQYDNRGSAWDTYQTTKAPEDYDAFARRYSSSSSSGQSPYQGSSSYSSASGQGVRVGGSASSSSSSQSGQPSYGSSSSYSSASRGYGQQSPSAAYDSRYGQPSQSAAYDSRYGQQAPQQPAYDSRYGQQAPQQSYGQSYDSRYSQPSPSGRYDQYGTSQGSQDSRYDQYGRPVDPRYNVAYRQPATPGKIPDLPEKETYSRKNASAANKLAKFVLQSGTPCHG